jgi:Derlin-2/3
MIEAWYYDVPPVTRTYVSLCFLTTCACALEIITPLTLYFNARAICTRMQVWRLATNFLYFGPFGLDFVFHMFFLVRYSRLLEEGSFRMRTADFIYMLLFGAVVMTVIAPFINIQFFGSSLTFMMVYVWGRRNESVRMSFLGVFQFNAPYLPWVLLAFSVLIGNTYVVDTIGIAVGHIYCARHLSRARRDVQRLPMRSATNLFHSFLPARPLPFAPAPSPSPAAASYLSPSRLLGRHLPADALWETSATHAQIP